MQCLITSISVQASCLCVHVCTDSPRRAYISDQNVLTKVWCGCRQCFEVQCTPTAPYQVRKHSVMN